MKKIDLTYRIESEEITNPSNGRGIEEKGVVLFKKTNASPYMAGTSAKYNPNNRVLLSDGISLKHKQDNAGTSTMSQPHREEDEFKKNYFEIII